MTRKKDLSRKGALKKRGQLLFGSEKGLGGRATYLVEDIPVWGWVKETGN